MRAIRTRETHFPRIDSFLSCSSRPTHKSHRNPEFYQVEIAFQIREKKIIHFSAIFSLFGAISPHIPIGAHDGGAHHFPFSFTAKATPTYTQTLLTTVPPQSTRTTFTNDRAHNPPLSNQKVALSPTYNHDVRLSFSALSL